MFIPFISKRSPKGGGGGRGGGGEGGGESGGGGSSSGGRGGTSGGSSGSSGSTSSGAAHSVPLSGSGVAGRTSATAYGAGGGALATIPSGQLFAGRQEGGGTRAQVYGTQTYGSGYPGVSSRGVSGLGFPFYFWPVVWGGTAIGGAAYLHDTEYGDVKNSSRPGGQLMTVPFTSASGNTTLRLVSDNSTTTALASIIGANCSTLISGNQNVVVVPSNSNSSNNTSGPFPEQAVQYYRASSIVLTLDGYNNTDALQANSSSNVPIPSWVNQTLLQCVNQTIGAAAPLIDASSSSHTISLGTGNMGLMCLFWMIGYLFFGSLL